jgi:Tol biopolymer transport system component
VLATAGIVLSLSLVALLTSDSDGEVRVLQPPPTDLVAEEEAPTTTVPPEPTTSTSTSTTSTTLPRRPGVRMDGDPVAYAWKGDIWLYGRSSGEVARVTADGDDRFDTTPAFRGRDRLTFVSTPTVADWPPPSTLEEIDLATGTHRIVAMISNWVRTYAWTPDGSSVVYIAGTEEQHELRLLTPGTGTDVMLRTLGEAPGRGGFANYDQVRLTWSPDGTRLLVVDTHVDSTDKPTMFVVRADGTDVVAPRAGTWAAWSPDSRTVYFQWDGVAALDTTTGAVAPVPDTGKAFRLAVSPDGQFLAYDNGANPPSVFVYDLVGHTARRLHAEALAPMWLSANTLLAGRAVECVPNPVDDCVGGGHSDPWTDAGSAWEIDVAPTASRPVPVASTRDAAIRPSR